MRYSLSTFFTMALVLLPPLGGLTLRWMEEGQVATPVGTQAAKQNTERQNASVKPLPPQAQAKKSSGETAGEQRMLALAASAPKANKPSPKTISVTTTTSAAAQAALDALIKKAVAGTPEHGKSGGKEIKTATSKPRDVAAKKIPDNEVKKAKSETGLAQASDKPEVKKAGAAKTPALSASAPIRAAKTKIAKVRENRSGSEEVSTTASLGKTEKPAIKVASAKQDQNDGALNVTKPEVVAKPLPIKTTLKVLVDLTTQTVQVKEHGVEKYSWAISSGKGRYRTPGGTFKPTWMSRMHYSRQWDNAPMPYAVFFNNGVAFHGTQYVRSLGRPASHGCIRLRTSNAKKLFKLVQLHGRAATRIDVSGVTPYVEPRVAASGWKPAPKRKYRRRKKEFWPFDGF